MDMWPAFRKSFLGHCPKGRVIYDKFHVIQHLIEAVNEVRKQELKHLGGALKGFLSGKKFVPLSPTVKPEELSQEGPLGVPSRQPPAPQGVSYQGVLRPHLGFQVPALGGEVFPEVGQFTFRTQIPVRKLS